MKGESPFIDSLAFKVITNYLSIDTNTSENNDFEIFKIFFDIYIKLKEYYTTNSLSYIYNNISIVKELIYKSANRSRNILKEVYKFNDMTYKHWIFSEFDNREQLLYILEILNEYAMHLYILKHNTLCYMPKLHDIVLYMDKDDKINIIIQMECLKNLRDIKYITDERIESILNKHQYAFNKNENSLHQAFVHYIANIFEELNKKYKFTYYDRNLGNIFYNTNNDIVVLDFDDCGYKAMNYLHDKAGLCKHLDFNNLGRHLSCEICHYDEMMYKYADSTNIQRRNSI